MDNSIWGNDAVGCWIGIDNFEFDCSHGSLALEDVTLHHWAVGLGEVWLQENVEKIARDALDRVVDWEHVNALSVLDVSTRHQGNNITQTDTDI